MAQNIRIGGASGYWGESPMATPQLLNSGPLDFLVFDYLAEITMSIMARARAKDPAKGYAADFIDAVLEPHLKDIAEKGVRVISNAGGVNPSACGAAARALVEKHGLNLKVAVIEGDDLLPRKDEFADAVEMFTGETFPAADKIASMNSYIGAFPIAKALDDGADIVITGRIVDSAATLGPCIHAFGWSADDFDRLAAGSLAGHILECGPQAAGGNYTDWRDAGDLANIGYPIAEIEPDGAFSVSKPDGTGGIVRKGTIAEQLVYEIGDPQNYLLPDLTADFSEVAVEEKGENIVRVTGATGRAPGSDYKTCVTYQDGYRAGVLVSFTGLEAGAKAKAFAESTLARARQTFRKFNAGDFTETSVEILGAGAAFGGFDPQAKEVVLKIAAKHDSAMGAGVLLKELSGLGLATPAGLSIFNAGRPKPSPVVRLFSTLVPKNSVPITIDFGDGPTAFEASSNDEDAPSPDAHTPANTQETPDTEVPLVRLAWARSGDKGNKANVGVIARDDRFMPYIWAALSDDALAERFGHFIEGNDKQAKIHRFYLPGLPAMNVLIDDVLGGGGVASLRNDAQGKAFGQILLDMNIPVPTSLVKDLP